MSVSLKKRRRRVARLAAPPGAAIGPSAAQPRQVISLAKRRYDPKETGLDYLLKGRQISLEQWRLGRRYGLVYRVADLGEDPPIRSSLECLEVASAGGSVGGGLPPAAMGEAEWVAWARIELDRARAIFAYEPGILFVLDAICGRHFRPRELQPEQRLADEYRCTLTTALDQLEAHRWGRDTREA